MAEPVTRLPIKKESTEPAPGDWRPLTSLRREIDRLFDDFGWGPGRWPSGRSLFDMEPFWRGELSFGKVPAVDVAEKDKEYEITAELPGLDENNVEVKFAEGMLTIKGEKKAEHERKNGGYSYMERRYGSFTRSIRLPFEAADEEADARYDKGVLTIRVPKPAEVQKSVRRIEVKAA